MTKSAGSSIEQPHLLPVFRSRRPRFRAAARGPIALPTRGQLLGLRQHPRDRSGRTGAPAWPSSVSARTATAAMSRSSISALAAPPEGPADGVTRDGSGRPTSGCWRAEAGRAQERPGGPGVLDRLLDQGPERARPVGGRLSGQVHDPSGMTGRELRYLRGRPSVTSGEVEGPDRNSACAPCRCGSSDAGSARSRAHRLHAGLRRVRGQAAADHPDLMLPLPELGHDLHGRPFPVPTCDPRSR